MIKKCLQDELKILTFACVIINKNKNYGTVINDCPHVLTT